MDTVAHPSEECSVNIGRFLEYGVSPRYHYGELRRPCIDTIYRFTPPFFLRYSIAGYFYKEDLAVVFYKRQVAWPVVASAFFSLILSAMQVGFAVTPLNDNYVLIGSHMALLFYKFPRRIYHDCCACCLRQPVDFR